MAEIIAFNPSDVRPKRMSGHQTKPLGELVFFTGVRYERWIKTVVSKPKPQPSPSKPHRIKSKA